MARRSYGETVSGGTFDFLSPQEGSERVVGLSVNASTVLVLRVNGVDEYDNAALQPDRTYPLSIPTGPYRRRIEGTFTGAVTNLTFHFA